MTHVKMKNVWSQTNPITVRSTTYEWNVELDRKLFDPTPPDGYLDNTPRDPN